MKYDEQHTFERGTGVVVTTFTSDGERMGTAQTDPQMHRYDAQAVMVLSFFPGNGSGSSLGGFNWRPIAEADKLRADLDKLLADDHPGESSVTYMRMYVPKGLDENGITAYLDEHINERECTPQDFSDLPLVPGGDDPNFSELPSTGGTRELES